MPEIPEIEQFAKKEFSDLLLQHGFRAPVVTRGETKTQIDFLRDDFAVEVELDWRDFVAFVLIVRLESGCLPSGYYMSRGQRCRKHLARVIQEQGWETLKGPRFGRGLARPADGSDLKALLLKYKAQLAACIGKVVELGAAAF